MRMNGGRAETEVEYDIGFDDTGRILALEIQVTVFAVPSLLSLPRSCPQWLTRSGLCVLGEKNTSIGSRGHTSVLRGYVQ